MPGALPHLIAGFAMFIIGRYYFKDYFEGENRVNEQYLLLFVCMFFSFIPDIFMIIFYITRISSSDIFMLCQMLLHGLVVPIAIIILAVLNNNENIKRKPIWIMGMLSMILHVIMDIIIPEYGIWI